MQQISIIDQADQSFGIVVDTYRISMRLRYSTVSDRWSFDLSVDDVPVIHGRRLVGGVDLLAPFDLGIGGLVVYPVTPGSVPGRQELVDGRVGLFFLTKDEIGTVTTETVSNTVTSVATTTECCVPDEIVGGTY